MARSAIPTTSLTKRWSDEERAVALEWHRFALHVETSFASP